MQNHPGFATKLLHRLQDVEHATLLLADSGAIAFGPAVLSSSSVDMPEAVKDTSVAGCQPSANDGALLICSKLRVNRDQTDYRRDEETMPTDTSAFDIP